MSVQYSSIIIVLVLVAMESRVFSHCVWCDLEASQEGV